VILGLQTFASSEQSLPVHSSGALSVTQVGAFPSKLPGGGALGLLTSAGWQVVTYTSISGSSFKFSGGSGGVGTLPANGLIIGLFTGLGAGATTNIPAVVQNYAQLRSLPAPVQGAAVHVLGANAPGDGGDGLFLWDQNSPPTGALNDNVGMVLQSFLSSTGRWRRTGCRLITNALGFQLDTGPAEISPLWFGAVGDGTTDNTAAFAAALSALAITGGTLRIPAGMFKMRSMTAGVPLAICQPDGGQSLPAPTINVNNTTGFPERGTLQIFTSTGWQVATYTGTTPTSFTGVTGGTSATISAGIALATAGVRIVGSGFETILSFAISGQTPGLTLQGSNTTLENLTITSTGTTTQQAVYISGNTGPLKISEVWFMNNPGGALNSGDFLIDILIEFCQFTGNSGPDQPITAQIVGNSCTTVSVHKCNFSNNYNNISGIGMKITILDGPNITDSIFESSGTLLVAQGGASTRIEGCYFEDSQGSVISSNYTFGAGVLTVRSCFFNKGEGISGVAVITSSTGAVVLDGCTFSGFSVSAGDFLNLQGATLGSIRMQGNVSDDPAFGSLVEADDDQSLGGVQSYTNLATHSSFEDASHVSSLTNLTATQGTIGYLGRTSQQLTWASGATGYSDAAVFGNTLQSMTTGDVFTVSFYAIASRGATIVASWNGAEGLGQFAIRLTTAWRRYVIKSLPAVTTGAQNYLYLVPEGLGSALTVNVDGVQVEKNVRFPGLLVSTTSGPMTVTNSPNPTHPLAQGASPTVGAFNSNWGTISSTSVTGGDAAGLIAFTTSGGTQAPISAGVSLFTITLARAYAPGTAYIVLVSPTGGFGALTPLAGTIYGVPGSGGFTVYASASFTPINNTQYEFSFITIGTGATN
jgi:hypothetical protein